MRVAPSTDGGDVSHHAGRDTSRLPTSLARRCAIEVPHGNLQVGTNLHHILRKMCCSERRKFKGSRAARQTQPDGHAARTKGELNGSYVQSGSLFNLLAFIPFFPANSQIFTVPPQQSRTPGHELAYYSIPENPTATLDEPPARFNYTQHPSISRHFTIIADGVPVLVGLLSLMQAIETAEGRCLCHPGNFCKECTRSSNTYNLLFSPISSRYHTVSRL